ncbi:hypothetical protein NC652_017390 [Populus alba x Populus x berolinensis]|nr:hypothetical protein NC652_017390 [Populus alba x Populus x berolinensis]
MLQPFPPPTPPPSLTPSSTATTPLISRDKVRDALLMLIQDDQFIDMFHQALLKLLVLGNNGGIAHGWSKGMGSLVQCLSVYTTENGLSEAFSQYGQVVEAKIVMDRTLDRSKGFGFVTYASEDEAQKALDEMNGKALNGRVIYVQNAKPKTNFGGGIPIARGLLNQQHLRVELRGYNFMSFAGRFRYLQVISQSNLGISFSSASYEIYLAIPNA